MAGEVQCLALAEQQRRAGDGRVGSCRCPSHAPSPLTPDTRPCLASLPRRLLSIMLIKNVREKFYIL
ncbi:hypothetical protein E2C01_099305 [Portunus trituberculatus]|uniref:Uncharacterized protein n=1 Tax=Portunus trituberculatus TaxID=210409 RepID=A0A5B7K9A6_PORTR|nr:hypothetical protein [Portunus trituberculatus]